MVWSEAELGDGFSMLGGRISGIRLPVVVGVDLGQIPHQLIPVRLRQDARRGNRHKTRVPLHEASVRRQPRLTPEAIPIDQQVIRLDPCRQQRPRRPPHPEEGRLQDVDLVDFLRADKTHCPSGVALDSLTQFIALFFSQLLAVIELRIGDQIQRDLLPHPHRSRDDRPSEAAPPRFVATDFESSFLEKRCELSHDFAQ